MSKVPHNSKAGFFQHCIAAGCFCSFLSSLQPQGSLSVGKQGLCLAHGEPRTAQIWGTACFILLLPEALGPSGDGAENMCRAAALEGNGLSIGRSFPSLCEPLATLSLARQRKQDLHLLLDPGLFFLRYQGFFPPPDLCIQLCHAFRFVPAQRACRGCLRRPLSITTHLWLSSPSAPLALVVLHHPQQGAGDEGLGDCTASSNLLPGCQCHLQGPHQTLCAKHP